MRYTVSPQKGHKKDDDLVVVEQKEVVNQDPILQLQYFA